MYYGSLIGSLWYNEFGQSVRTPDQAVSFCFCRQIRFPIPAHRLLFIIFTTTRRSHKRAAKRKIRAITVTRAVAALRASRLPSPSILRRSPSIVSSFPLSLSLTLSLSRWSLLSLSLSLSLSSRTSSGLHSSLLSSLPIVCRSPDSYNLSRSHQFCKLCFLLFGWFVFLSFLGGVWWWLLLLWI
jgi:hypothetical protein